MYIVYICIYGVYTESTEYAVIYGVYIRFWPTQPTRANCALESC